MTDTGRLGLPLRVAMISGITEELYSGGSIARDAFAAVVDKRRVAGHSVDLTWPLFRILM